MADRHADRMNTLSFTRGERPADDWAALRGLSADESATPFLGATASIRLAHIARTHCRSVRAGDRPDKAGSLDRTLAPSLPATLKKPLRNQGLFYFLAFAASHTGLTHSGV